MKVNRSVLSFVIVPLVCLMAGLLSGHLAQQPARESPASAAGSVASIGSATVTFKEIPSSEVERFHISGDPWRSVSDLLESGDDGRSVIERMPEFFALLNLLSVEDTKLLSVEEKDDAHQLSEMLRFVIKLAATDRWVELAPREALAYGMNATGWFNPGPVITWALAARNWDLLEPLLRDPDISENKKEMLALAMGMHLAESKPRDGLKLLVENGASDVSGFFDYVDANRNQLVAMRAYITENGQDGDDPNATRDLLAELHARWAQLDPESLLDDAPGSDAIRVAFKELASQAPTRALERMKQDSRLVSIVDAEAIAGAFQSVLDSSGVPGLQEWLDQVTQPPLLPFPQRSTVGVLLSKTKKLQVLSHLQYSDDATAIALIDDLAPLELAAAPLAEFARQSREGALHLAFRILSEKNSRAKDKSEAAKFLASVDLERARNGVIQISDPTVREAAYREIAGVVGEKDRAQAVSILAEAVTSGHLSASAEPITESVRKWAAKEPAQAMAWMTGQQAIPDSPDMVANSGVMSVMTQQDAEVARDWLLAMRDQSAQFGDLLAQFVTPLSNRDPDAVEAFMLEHLQDDPAHLDVAAERFADQIAEWDPPRALEWSAKISDPEMRAASIVEALDGWRSYLPGQQPDLADALEDIPLTVDEKAAILANGSES